MAQIYKNRTDPKTIMKEKIHRIVGRDKKEIDPEIVKAYASCGVPDVRIAEWLGLSISTLKYNFGDVLIDGRMDLELKLRTKQVQLALGGSEKMLIWLGKNILNQADQPQASVDSTPLPVVTITDEGYDDDDEADQSTD